VFGELEFPLPSLPVLVTSASTAAAPSAAATTPATATVLSHIDSGLFSIVDPEIARDNPVEEKHLRLVRSHRSGPLDREMKPNAATRDELNVSHGPVSSLSSCIDPLSRQFSNILLHKPSIRQNQIYYGSSAST